MTLMNPKTPRITYRKTYSICQHCGNPYQANPKSGKSKYCKPCKPLIKREYEHKRYRQRKQKKCLAQTPS